MLYFCCITLRDICFLYLRVRLISAFSCYHYESIMKFPITFNPVMLAAAYVAWLDPLFCEGLQHCEFIILSVIFIQNCSVTVVLKSVAPTLVASVNISWKYRFLDFTSDLHQKLYVQEPVICILARPLCYSEAHQSLSICCM